MAEQTPVNLRTIPRRWCEAWSQDDFSKWISLYSPGARYTDHAFRLTRSTYDSLHQHFDVRRNAQPNFVMEINPEYPMYWSGTHVDEEFKVLFRTTNTGTYLTDTPTSKASGTRVSFIAVVELTVGKGDGLIREVEEWYSRDFDGDSEGHGYVVSK